MNLLFLFTGTLSEKAAFHAHLSQHVSVHAGLRLIFSSVITNIGSGYSRYSGIFTCHVPGVYLFNCAISSKCNDFIVTELMRNGVMVGTHEAVGTSEWDTQSSSSTIVQLNYGDRVWVQVKNSHSSSPIYDTNYSTFSGVLIHT